MTVKQKMLDKNPAMFISGSNLNNSLGGEVAAYSTKKELVGVSLT
jgi:hypothetical protein